jgi:hypothetical protein
MNALDVVFYITIIILIIACAYFYYQRNAEAFQLKCIVSTVDGEKYCVRERDRIQEAADLLAKVSEKCDKLVQHTYHNHSEDPRVQQLYTRFDRKKIMETLPTSEYTAYSENKGEKVAFCLNKKKEDDEDLIDEHTLTFVSIHELAHIMTTSTGHGDDFWENFKFLLERAKESGIHDPEDYKSAPAKYCGMTIHDNPIFDQ